MKDCILYDNLGLSPYLTDEEIKKEGKKLLLQYHPDKNLQNSEEASKKFIEIKEILDILINKREEYHTYGVNILYSQNIFCDVKVDPDCLTDPEKEEKIKINYQQTVPCDLCKCNECNGKGTVQKTNNDDVFETPCFICGGIGFFTNICNQIKHFVTNDKTMMLGLKQNILRKLATENQTISIKTEDYDLVISFT